MSDIYATHMLVLRLMGHVVNPSAVLELGAGFYSTGLFLDRETYPALRWLDSVEVNDEWRSMVRDRYADERLTLYSGMPSRLLDSYGLIFIDDGQSAEERVRTIARVAQARVIVPVVIHDFENPAYRQAADFEWLVEYDGMTPHTAICWNGDALSEAQQEAIDAEIYLNARR